MVMSAVIDPDGFSRKEFEQAGYQDQVAMLFRGIEENGVILLDLDGQLLVDLEEKVAQLPIKYRQDLETRLVEFKKKRNRGKLIKCRADICGTSPGQRTSERIKRVASGAKADAVFSTLGHCQTNSAGDQVSICPISQYISSDFEKQRHSYMSKLESFDESRRRDFDELIIRATRFSVWLRFYDKQIGKGSNVSNFRRGIHHILKLWSENAHFPPEWVQVFTTQAPIIKTDQGQYVCQQKAEKNRDASQKVIRELITPLQEEFGFRVDLVIKRVEPRERFHARFLQTQTVSLLFEGGFDILESDESMKTSLVKIDNGNHLYLGKFRALPNATHL